MLEVRDLGVRLGRQSILSDVSLRLDGGEIVGLVAPNGTGKTTLMRTVSGIYRRFTGDIRIDGTSIKRLSKHDYHKLFFFADTGHCVLPTLTVKEHLVYVRSAWHSDVSIDEVVESLGIGWFLNKRMGSLSLGMAQLAVIAMSIVSDAPYLIFDEPMNGLDPTITQEVTRRFLLLAADGKSIFISSHLLDHLDQLANRVLFLREGEIVCEHTPHAGLSTLRRYQSIYGGESLA